MRKIRVTIGAFLGLVLSFALLGCSADGGESSESGMKESASRYSVSINGEMYYADSTEETNALIEERSLDDLGADEANYIEADGLIEVESGEFDGSDYGYANFSFKVRNGASFPVDYLTLDICLFDKGGDIVDATYPQEQVVVDPGQSIVIDALADESSGACAAKVTGYSFWNADGDTYVVGSVDESPEILFG